jgi:hypothetical protein
VKKKLKSQETGTMATERNKVSSYVSDSIYEKLLEFKAGHRLKSISLALTVILHDYLGIAPTTPDTPLGRNSILCHLHQLEETINCLTQEQGQLKQALEQVKATVAENREKIENAVLVNGVSTRSKGIKRVPVLTPIEPHSGTELSRRLGVSKSTISLYKKRADFPEWSREQDPQGVAWIYIPQQKQFNYLNLPVEENRGL